MTRRFIVISLTVEFVVGWLLWLAVWLKHLESPAFALLAPVVPVYFGSSFLARGDLDMALVSLGLTVVTLFTLVMAFRCGARWFVVLGAHVCLFVYWLWSFALVALGV